MRLNIIIPNYNSEKTIAMTLNSIINSNIKCKYDITVIDNNSNDEGLQIINKFKKINLIELDKNYGASKARNIGIKKTKGDILIFIDSDIWFNKNSIKLLLDSFDKNTDIVYPKIIFENKKLFYPILEIEKKYIHISGCFAIKRKSLHKLDENFDEYYQTYLEDYDFFMRCNNAHLNAKYNSNVTVIHANKINGTDYSSRYYLETRNTLYGILKLGKIRKESPLYNPFRISSLIKIFFFGVINFAWFNWQGYDRNKKSITKNKICKNQVKLIYLYFKAIFITLINIKSIQNKRRQIIKYYFSPLLYSYE